MICVWSLLNGECKYKLNDNNDNKSIIKLELTENCVISLNRGKKLTIWNLVNGQLLNEFELKKTSLFLKQVINHFLCTNKYLITTSRNSDKQKAIFIFIWNYNYNESVFKLVKKLSINSKLVDQIKYLNMLKLGNNDFLLIHDSNDSIFLLEF